MKHDFKYNSLYVIKYIMVAIIIGIFIISFLFGYFFNSINKLNYNNRPSPQIIENGDFFNNLYAINTRRHLDDRCKFINLIANQISDNYVIYDAIQLSLDSYPDVWVVCLNNAEGSHSNNSSPIMQIWCKESETLDPYLVQEFCYIADVFDKSIIEQIGNISIVDNRQYFYLVCSESNHWKILTIFDWCNDTKRVNIIREDLYSWTYFLWYEPYCYSLGPVFYKYHIPPVYDDTLGHIIIVSYSNSGVRKIYRCNISDVINNDERILIENSTGNISVQLIRSAFQYRLRYNDEEWLLEMERIEEQMIYNARNLDGTPYIDNNYETHELGWIEHNVTEINSN